MTYDEARREWQERNDRANAVDLLAYARAGGYELEKDGREYCWKEHDSLRINPHKNCFNWNSRKVGGGPIQFVMYVEGKSRDEAVDILIGRSHAPVQRPVAEKKPPPPKKPFALPEKNGDYRRLFAYLTKTRGIDPATVQDMVNRGKLYESKDYHNCVFVSYDDQGVPVNYFMRGTYTAPGKKPFKCEAEGGNKMFPFVIEGDTNRAYAYEAAIDAMSDITLSKLRGQNPANHHRITMGGVYGEALMNYLQRNPQINFLILRTDNDAASKEFIRKYGGELLLMGVAVKADLPEAKDINQELLDYRQRAQDEAQEQ